jgi:Tol biopolymer transport system component
VKAGTRLGPYEIVAPIGAGGMGEVYKARDTRLERTVAIKVLPPEWAESPDMKQRFDREAQVIASLNHPNICKLHDLGESAPGISYLVMEHLDGETLAERLTRGPVPVDEALRIGIAIGDALDKAHRHGVVHRDLKPANVMLVRSGGTSTPPLAKLLDFGLAKLHAGVPSAGNQATRATPTPPITRAGVILGTLQYMAPEQLDGVEADARTDIFALGVVLHEMVTGKPAFQGKSQVLLMSAIATVDPPPLSRVQPTVPPALDHVVKTCLAKDPDDRWQAARDVVAELQWIAGGGGATDEAVPATAGPRGQTRAMRFALAGAGLVALILAVPAALYVKGAPAPEKIELRVSIHPLLYSGNSASNGFFAVSPDGRQLVMRANPAEGQDALYVGTFDFLSPRRLEGTYNANQVFWSPDGRSIAFVADNKLQRIEAAGGPPQPICDVQDFRGGTWNRDGTIVFGSPRGLFSVRADGGKPTALTTVASSEAGHFWPRFLPDGRRFLYLSWSATPADRIAMAGSLDAKDTTRIMPSDSNVVFTEPGYLVFWRERTLYAQPFDAGSLRLSGDATRLADDIARNASTGRAVFDVSADGVLAYHRDTTTRPTDGSGRDETVRDFQLAWINRLGQEPQPVGKPGVYRGVELSPDGRRIAVHRHDPKGGDVWVFEPNGTETRVTFNAPYDNSNPVWSTDGTRLAYASLRNGKWGLYQASADGSGNEELLLESELPKAPLQWTPDGQFLLYWVRDPKTADDIWVWPASDKKPRPLLATDAEERDAQVSPDGKWIVYSSTLNGVMRPGVPGAGRPEIFVQPFPVPGTARWQVSPDSDDGGRWPRWNPKTSELLYRAPVNGPWFSTGWLFSVSWKAKGAAFTHEARQQFLRINALNYPHSGGDYHTYAVSPDGQRFLIFQYFLTGGTATTSSDADPAAGVTVLMHWTPGLKK